MTPHNDMGLDRRANGCMLLVIPSTETERRQCSLADLHKPNICVRTRPLCHRLVSVLGSSERRGHFRIKDSI